MPEIRFPNPTAWATFELETKLIDPPALRLELTPRKKKEIWEAAAVLKKYYDAAGPGATDIPDDLKVAAMDDLIPRIVDHVAGWDLTQDGQPIPCEPKTRFAWLEPLLWETVKPSTPAGEPSEDGGEEEEPAVIRWLWSEIMRFIANPENFRKN